MRSRRIRLVGILLAACAAASLMACSAQKKPRTTIVWRKTDGSPATREEVEAAGQACAAETRASGREGTGRFAHVEWSVSMLECMKNKGYERVETPVP